ncbi:MAG: zinc dependent phospholipase C family protein [Bacilli bacterium]|nr:zinc dependent phospholipase C family protein [Bacilli bacterium]
MASAIIHMAIASELNKDLKRDESKLLIGTIAPDISKLVGETKIKSHFQLEEDEIPHLDLFLKKYKKYLYDDFVLGYYIHLFVDYLWFKYFMSEIYGKYITKLDGTVVEANEENYKKYIYNDYTNLNIRLIDEYDMNLKIFYNDIPKLNKIIEEIPMDKINIVIDKVSLIIENSKTKKDYVFNIENIKRFIDTSVKLIGSDLNDLLNGGKYE